MSTGMGILAATMVGMLVLAQGGFYLVPVCVAGVVALVVVVERLVVGSRSSAARTSCGKRRGRASEGSRRSFDSVSAFVGMFVGTFVRERFLLLTFLVVAALNGASAAVHGLDSEAWGSVGCWLSLAAFSFLCQGIGAGQRVAALNGFGWFVVATAAAGMLAAAGVLPPEGTMAAGRLCIFFEYSNATGIWFGIGAMLLAASDDERLRSLAAASLFALLLTKSVGAIAVTFVMLAVALVVLLHRDENGRVCMLAASWLTALAAFAVYLFAPVAGVVVAVAACAGLLWLGRYSDRHAAAPRGGKGVKAAREAKGAKATHGKGARASRGKQGGRAVPPVVVPLWRESRGLALLAVLATLTGVAVVVVREPGRWTQAQGTFAERFVQIHDGLMLLAADPWLGVGPGQWAELYPTVQTVDYIATVNHCSYLQMALDAGVAAPLLFVVAMGVATMRCARSGRPLWALAVGALLVHSLLDFDLSFYALLFLAVLLVGEGRDPLSQEVRS